MFRIQFVTSEKSRGGYVCQFCEEDDPTCTIRLTHPALSGLKVMALKAMAMDPCPIFIAMENLDRIDTLFNRVAEAERNSPDDDEDEDQDGDACASAAFLGDRDLADFVGPLHGRTVVLKTRSIALVGQIRPTIPAGVSLTTDDGLEYGFSSDEVTDIRLLPPSAVAA